MASFRTTDAKVRDILGSDDESIKTTPFIETANSLVTNYIVTACGATYNATQLELIERWLAAHYYEVNDRRLSEENTGRAGGVFEGKTEMGFNSTRYGQSVLDLDYEGCLANLSANQGKRTIGGKWQGTKPTDRVADFWR